MSIRTFAVFVAVASVTVYAKRYLEKTSIAVKLFSYPPLGGKFDSKSICMASLGPMSHSGELSSSGVMDVLGILLSLIQVLQP